MLAENHKSRLNNALDMIELCSKNKGAKSAREYLVLYSNLVRLEEEIRGDKSSGDIKSKQSLVTIESFRKSIENIFAEGLENTLEFYDPSVDDLCA